jgi:hypothetical protein
MANTQQVMNLIKTGGGRPYIQFGGSRPNNQPLFYGGETNFMALSGLSAPVRGGVSPINMHDPYANARYRAVDSTIDAPDLPNASVMIRHRVGALPRHLVAANCKITNYMLFGACRDLSQFDVGWESFIYVLSNGLVTDRDLGDLFMWDADDPNEANLSLTYESAYGIGQVGFGEKNAAAITLEILDVCYMNQVACGDCGINNDGTQKIYVSEKGGAAAKPIIHYSLDGGVTWSTSSVVAAANAESLVTIRVMGSYLVALSPTASSATQGGYYYAPLNTLTGAPGTWVKVTAGFTNNQQPRDMFVVGPREAYICADTGEILKLTDVVSGPRSLGQVSASNLSRIDGSADAIVAVGANAACVVSVNRGLSWAATPTSPGAATQNAVQTIDRYRIWVGDASGVVRYTLDGGNTWTTQGLGLTLASVQDIKVASPEVIWITGLESTTPRLVGTNNGGYSWFNSGNVVPRITGVPSSPTAQRWNRIAVPGIFDNNVNANYAVLGGLGVATDGSLLVGSANMF